MNEWILLAIGLALTVGTGFFVASEFALVNLDRADLESREAKGERHLGPIIGALKITSTHLSSAQLGITLTTLLTGYTMEPAISSLLERPLLATRAARGLRASHRRGRRSARRHPAVDDPRRARAEEPRARRSRAPRPRS